MQRLLKKFTLSAAAALVFAGSAHAYVVDFESVNSSSAPFAPLLADGDMVTQGDYFINTQDLPRGGGLVGQLSNGLDPGSCLNGGPCPGANASNFLSIYNDGIAHFGRLDGAAFTFGGLSAAYIGVPSSPAGSTVYLAVEADRSDGSYAAFAYLLPSNGSFMTIGATGGTRLAGTGLLTDDFVIDLFVYAYFCNGSSACNAFRTGLGQFALDDVVLNALAVVDPEPVPEPAAWALIAIGLGALGATRRRRRSA